MKCKPFPRFKNCQTVANRFPKVIEIIVAKPSNRHEPPRQVDKPSNRQVDQRLNKIASGRLGKVLGDLLATWPRTVPEARNVGSELTKRAARAAATSPMPLALCQSVQSARPSKLNLAHTSIACSKRAKRMAVQASRKSNRSKPFSGLWH